MCENFLFEDVKEQATNHLAIILQSIRREPSMKRHMEDLDQSKDEEIFEHLENHHIFRNSLLFNDDDHYYDDEEEHTPNDDLCDDDLISWCSDLPSYIKDDPLFEPLPLEGEDTLNDNLYDDDLL